MLQFDENIRKMLGFVYCIFHGMLTFFAFTVHTTTLLEIRQITVQVLLSTGINGSILNSDFTFIEPHFFP